MLFSSVSPAEHVNRAWAAKSLPRNPCSAISRSTLRFRSIVFCHARSPLRSTPPDFRLAPLRFPLRSHALVACNKERLIDDCRMQPRSLLMCVRCTQEWQSIRDVYPLEVMKQAAFLFLPPLPSLLPFPSLLSFPRLLSSINQFFYFPPSLSIPAAKQPLKSSYKGPGKRCELSQRVRAEPDRLTILVHFKSKYIIWTKFWVVFQLNLPLQKCLKSSPMIFSWSICSRNGIVWRRRFYSELTEFNIHLIRMPNRSFWRRVCSL